jgi:hypothetical protein
MEMENGKRFGMHLPNLGIRESEAVLLPTAER